MANLPRVPTGLRSRGRAFWKKVHKDFTFCGQGELELLHSCCKALDTIARAEQALQRDGLFIEDRFNVQKEHPAAKTIRDYTALFSRLVKQLGLKEPEEKRPVGRPGFDAGRVTARETWRS